MAWEETKQGPLAKLQTASSSMFAGGGEERGQERDVHSGSGFAPSAPIFLAFPEILVQPFLSTLL